MSFSSKADSGLRAAFQTAAAFMAGLVGENPNLGAVSGGNLYDHLKDAIKKKL